MCTHSQRAAAESTQTCSAKRVLNPNEVPFVRAYFTHPLSVASREYAHACFLHTNLRILKEDSALWSFQPSGFVIAVKLNTGGHSTEHTTLVSRWVSAIFFFFFFSYSCVSSVGFFIFHTKADKFFYLLRAKQIDMTIYVSFIWGHHGTESLQNTSTHTKRQWEALVLADSSGMGNAQWTFVILSGCGLPGCFSTATDRSERLPVRNIIPAFHRAQPIHILFPPACIVCLCVHVPENGKKHIARLCSSILLASLASDRPLVRAHPPGTDLGWWEQYRDDVVSANGLVTNHFPSEKNGKVRGPRS